MNNYIPHSSYYRCLPCLNPNRMVLLACPPRRHSAVLPSTVCVCSWGSTSAQPLSGCLCVNHISIKSFKNKRGTSLVVQWLGLSWWLGGNLPADAGHVSSVPDLGRFHMPWSTQLHAIATALVLQPCRLRPLKPECLRVPAP